MSRWRQKNRVRENSRIVVSVKLIIRNLEKTDKKKRGKIQKNNMGGETNRMKTGAARAAKKRDKKRGKNINNVTSI